VSSLAGKTALVTGAANGIGRATALALADAGARVLGLDLASDGAGVPIIKCDLARESDIVSAVASAAEKLGGIDILVNNAGIMEEASIGKITVEHIDRHFAVNVRGAILVTREALPRFSDGARIVNIASELAYLGLGLLFYQGCDAGSYAVMGARAGAARPGKCGGAWSDRHCTSGLRPTHSGSASSGNGKSPGADRPPGGNRRGSSVSFRIRRQFHYRPMPWRQRRCGNAMRNGADQLQLARF
jgi:hypothetical protein